MWMVSITKPVIGSLPVTASRFVFVATLTSWRSKLTRSERSNWLKWSSTVAQTYR